jgi:hypothetical protein
MTGKPHTPFKEDRPSLSPTDAAQRLVKLIEHETAETGYAHAYTGTVNTAFTRSGGTIPEYVAGINHGNDAGLFTVDDSGTRVKLGRHGIGWKRPPEGNKLT